MSFQYEQGASEKDEGRLFSGACCDKTGGNGFKVKDRFRLDVRMTFFIMSLVKQQRDLHRELVDAPSLETFMVRLDGPLSNLT